ncbi:metal-dependent hydrolase [Methylicorpusculum oleiharenae]|uniref:metal-dependent hydrolase n=1 Tax=Methylicorpusculum oleiharenae TaxID=1338687 RepID=UPI00135C51B1|nr:metal-dependent hydrolase [Methylicorpusculum oleiharenae]MCD2453652.1 metal-dependent hydrolase [Methylicorpusculum oleiharenae]
MTPVGHLITAASMATAFMRVNSLSWTHGIAGLPDFFVVNSSLAMSSSSGLTLISLGMVLGARGPDRLEFPVFNRLTKVRRSLIPHRTLTHWPGFWILATVISCTSFFAMDDILFQTIACVAIGFCSASWLHLIMDIMTPTGIPLLTPFGKRTTLNLYKTGSFGEWLYILVFLISSQLLASLLSSFFA